MKLDKAKKYCLISQTTQNVEEFKKIIAYLQKNLKNFTHINTICPSTDDRQKEVRVLAKNNDAVVVIGGKDSANSRMLYEISRSINKKTYFIENTRQLKKNWFNGIKKIAVSAGASTPEWIIKEVINKINSLA
jgi:4-hydroxy-3-methylbut-2-enyl diphosphate reductase